MFNSRSTTTSSDSMNTRHARRMWLLRSLAVVAVAAGSVVGVGSLAAGQASAATVTPPTATSGAALLAQMVAVNNQMRAATSPATPFLGITGQSALMSLAQQQQTLTTNSNQTAAIAAQVALGQANTAATVAAANQAVQSLAFQSAQQAAMNSAAAAARATRSFDQFMR